MEIKKVFQFLYTKIKLYSFMSLTLLILNILWENFFNQFQLVNGYLFFRCALRCKSRIIVHYAIRIYKKWKFNYIT